jgi:hypothetical protein
MNSQVLLLLLLVLLLLLLLFVFFYLFDFDFVTFSLGHLVTWSLFYFVTSSLVTSHFELSSFFVFFHPRTEVVLVLRPLIVKCLISVFPSRSASLETAYCRLTSSGNPLYFTAVDVNSTLVILQSG